jgi:hypothetical protein
MLSSITPAAAEYPQADISSESIHARLYLPDPVKGYYRGTRFDWSGIIASLEFQGHSYFGRWYEHHDPSVHDAITGPVEEFDPQSGGPGYHDANAGGSFVRMGVGILRKPDETTYRRYGTYEILNPGIWTIRPQNDSIEFVHELADNSGYACVYRKVVRLAGGQPELVLEHSLRNTGRRSIETTQYNHNFFVIDEQPTGPDFLIEFPFALRASEDLKGLAEVRGRQLVFLRGLQKGESILTSLEGFGKNASEHSFAVENRSTGAGVRIQGDTPLSKLIFWCIKTTFCPEPYIDIQLEPGDELRWRIAYHFYTVPSGAMPIR